MKRDTLVNLNREELIQHALYLEAKITEMKKQREVHRHNLRCLNKKVYTRNRQRSNYQWFCGFARG